MEDALNTTPRDILNLYGHPREITQDEALDEIRRVFAQAGHVQPTAFWLAFYRTQFGLLTSKNGNQAKHEKDDLQEISLQEHTSAQDRLAGAS